MEEALEISRRQCDMDKKAGKLRYSFEDLITLIREELLLKDQLRHNDWVSKFTMSG